MNLSIIVHGGAASIPLEKVGAKRAGCAAATQVGWRLLLQGATALDAVEAAIRVMEDDPAFNAGFGSMLNADGMVRMDAGFMEGRDLRAGAVGAVEGVRSPISIARRLMEETTVLMVGPYARTYAIEHALKVCPPEAMISPEQRRIWEQEQGEHPSRQLDKNTVGAIALDRTGNIACGVSTGGTGNNPPGRVGDSACVGGGFYADNAFGAAVMTGDGENILRLVLARTAVNHVQRGESPEQASAMCIEMLERRLQGEAGCIVMSPAGRIGWQHNSPNMACAYQMENMVSPAAYVHKNEERGEGIDHNDSQG